MLNIKTIFETLLRKFKVGTRLLLFLVFMLMLILFVTFLTIRHFSVQAANEYVFGYLQSEHQRVAKNIELYIEESIMVSLRYKNSSELYNLSQDAGLSETEKEAVLQTAAASIQEPVVSSIGNIYWVDYSGHTYPLKCTQPELPSPDISSLSKLRDNPYYEVGSIVRDSDGNSYIPVRMNFHNFNAGKSIGYLIFYLPEKNLAELYQNLLTNGGSSFISDSAGNVISDSNLANRPRTAALPVSGEAGGVYITDITYQGEPSVLISTPLNTGFQNIGFAWNLVSVVPYNKLYQILFQILATLLIAGIIVILIALAVSFLLSRRLTKPLRRLEQKLHELGNGKLDAFLNSHPADELWELEQGYNDMVLRINGLLERNRLEQEKKQELEFVALQAQINPHFLYNTLDSIGWIARLKEQKEIEQMVMELASFFRLSLHRGDKRITLEDEIEIASNYINIEQMRNPGKFQVHYDIQPELLQTQVPKLILQPVVENAIKHGVYQTHHFGQIVIKSYLDNEDLYLEVSDNGAGFTVTKGVLPPSSRGGGYGLRNVKERLQLEYGDSYGLDIWSEPDAGTRVRLHLRSGKR